MKALSPFAKRVKPKKTYTSKKADLEEKLPLLSDDVLNADFTDDRKPNTDFDGLELKQLAKTYEPEEKAIETSFTVDREHEQDFVIDLLEKRYKKSITGDRE